MPELVKHIEAGYRKIDQLVTEIRRKNDSNEPLTKDDIISLYSSYPSRVSVNRVEELRGMRDIKEDAPIFLDLKPEEIAWKPEDITENSKAYIGPLFKGLFDKGIEHIYTSFPEKRVEDYSVEIGGKTKEQLESELKDKDLYINSRTREFLNSNDFQTSSIPEQVDLIRLDVEDLGLPAESKTEEIYAKAQELGLELCPAEVGPQLRIAYTGTDEIYIAIEQRDYVFRLRAELGDKLRLDVNDASNLPRWYYKDFVFRHRKTLEPSDT
jgi:hypothetical protein